MVNVTMQYLQERRSKKLRTLSYRYRRAVERQLRGHLQQGEFTIPLGKTLAAAIKAYDRTHEHVEKMLADAWDQVNGEAKSLGEPPTPSHGNEFREALRLARVPEDNPYRGPFDDSEGSQRSEDVERRLTIPIHAAGSQVTLTDAKERYLEDRFLLREPTELERKKDEQRADRAVGAIVEALGRVPALASITREEARKVQTCLKGRVAAGTVDRYLNDIRSIVNHAIAEFPDLHGLKNHFAGLPILAGGRYGGPTAEEEGRPLTVEEATAIRARIEKLSRQPDLILIWRMVAGTGCRLAEVTGLRVVDVVANGEMPYLDIRPHERRRLKTVASVRRVPLVGDALEATKAALVLVGNRDMLFPRYGIEGGNTTASAALMKHVREIADDRLARVHSLRHNMADRLKLAGVEEADRKLVLGHALGGEGKRYGGPEGRLLSATRALRRALSFTPL